MNLKAIARMSQNHFNAARATASLLDQHTLDILRNNPNTTTAQARRTAHTQITADNANTWQATA